MILCCQCHDLLENSLLREAHNVNKTKKTPRDQNFGKEVLITPGKHRKIMLKFGQNNMRKMIFRLLITLHILVCFLQQARDVMRHGDEKTDQVSVLTS